MLAILAWIISSYPIGSIIGSAIHQADLASERHNDTTSNTSRNVSKGDGGAFHNGSDT